MSNTTLKSETSEKQHHLDGKKPSEFYNFIRDVYEQFRATCWAPEPYIDLEPVFCFNSALTFSG